MTDDIEEADGTTVVPCPVTIVTPSGEFYVKDINAWSFNAAAGALATGYWLNDREATEHTIWFPIRRIDHIVYHFDELLDFESQHD